MKFPSLSKTAFIPVLAAITALASLSTAMAKTGDVIKRANCPGSAKSKLKASPENGRIEVEYEIDNAVAGERWKIILKKGNRKIFKGVRTVNGAREIKVRKVTSNGAGTERISAKARNLNTGAQCGITLRFRS